MKPVETGQHGSCQAILNTQQMCTQCRKCDFIATYVPTLNYTCQQKQFSDNCTVQNSLSLWKELTVLVVHTDRDTSSH